MPSSGSPPVLLSHLRWPLLPASCCFSRSHGAPVTLCLAAGTYELDQPLRLNSQHDRMVIQGCGGAVTLRGVGEKFAEGLVVLTGAAGVTLRGITLIPQGTIVKPDLFNSLMVRLEFALPQAGDAIRVLQEVLKDRFAMSPPRQPVHLRMNDSHRLRCSNHSFAKSGPMAARAASVA